jgi:hypothetical protein
MRNHVRELQALGYKVPSNLPPDTRATPTPSTPRSEPPGTQARPSPSFPDWDAQRDAPDGRLAAACVRAAPAAQATNQYTVKANVAKPSVCKNSGTIAAGGWLASKPCGYIVGTVTSDTITHRLAIGRDFDNAPYFTASSYGIGRLRDPVGLALPARGRTASPAGTAKPR